ncbi:MAG: PAS domain S-box protein [Planctomycetes bacterium]|nr:PAS domain S-box protein [Planctomycetota bacterium]
MHLNILEQPDALSAVKEAHAELRARARADDCIHVHKAGGAWFCAWSSPDGAEMRQIDEAELPARQPAAGLHIGLRDLGAPVGAFERDLASRGIRWAVRADIVVGRRFWGWYVGRRAGEAFGEDERAVLEECLGPLAWSMAMRGVLLESDGSQEQLELILNHSPDAIIVVDVENRIRFFNEAAIEIFGYKADEVLGRKYDILLPPESRDKGEAERLRELAEQGASGLEQECLRWSKDGKPLALKVRWAAIKRPGGALVSRFSFIRDLRPIKRLREELVRAQSLAMVGELAASVAHEVRNPLASILAAIESMRAELDPSGTHQQTFRKILDRVQRLDNTIERLLVFAKPWEVSPREYDLAGVIQGIAMLLRREPESQNVEVAVHCPSPCAMVGDPHLVEHVLTNVLRNAIEAVPGGGHVQLAVESRDGVVEIAVRDDGPGISAEQQAKLFHPFFTTKSTGTGLGLATCQKIILAHRGSIRISNVAAGHGAEVLIRLPRAYR